MRPKRYRPPTDAGRVAVQALAIINADGFLAESAPFATIRIGRGKGAHSFAALLLSLEQRRTLERVVHEDVQWHLNSKNAEPITYTYTTARDGSRIPERMSWINACNLWVDVARFLALIDARPVLENTTHGQAMLMDLMRLAATSAGIPMGVSG